MDGTTGLIIAGVAAAGAALLSKKSETKACPPGSFRDEASGQCVVVRQEIVQVNGPAGQQANIGGESEVAKVTYEYNIAARNQWEKEAAQYAGDASIAAEFNAVMTLIQASTMFPDTPAGKASVDLLTRQINEAFDRIDATRARNAQLRDDKAFGDGRLALAVQYDAAKDAARNGLGDFSNAIKSTFLSAKDVVDYYLNKKNDVLESLQNISAGYTAVSFAIHLPHSAPYQADKWPSVLVNQLSNVNFAVPASRLSSIVPPMGKVDIVLSGLPRLPAQLAGVRTNFGLYNTWGAIAAGLKDAANPQSNTAALLEATSALGRGPGAIFCGRAVAVVMAAQVLAELEKEINKLEVLAHIFNESYKAFIDDVKYARGVEQTVSNGDGLFSSTTMRRTLDALKNKGGTVWQPYGGSNPENKSADYIKQQTFLWLQFRWGEEPLPISAALKAQYGAAVPDRANALFTLNRWGIGSADARKARFVELFEKLATWQRMISIVDVDYAFDDATAPNTASVAAKGLNLALVAGCSDAAIPFAAPDDYKTLTAKPDLTLIARNATGVEENTGLVGTRDELRTHVNAAFNGLGSCRSCDNGTVNVRNGAVRLDEPLRVSIGERVATRNGLGGLGGLGHLGDPIQQILSPLMGLNRRR